MEYFQSFYVTRTVEKRQKDVKIQFEKKVGKAKGSEGDTERNTTNNRIFHREIFNRGVKNRQIQGRSQNWQRRRQISINED